MTIGPVREMEVGVVVKPFVDKVGMCMYTFSSGNV